MSDIYVNVNELMRRKKLLQIDLAKELGVDKKTVNNWLNLKKGMRAEKIPLIAKFLNVSINELYGVTEKPFKTVNEPPPNYYSKNDECNELRKEIKALREKHDNLNDKYNELNEKYIRILEEKNTNARNCG